MVLTRRASGVSVVIMASFFSLPLPSLFGPNMEFLKKIARNIWVDKR